MLRVSVGIPAYNEGVNARRLAEQILVQEAHGFALHEIVVVDDGSTDATAAEVQKLSDPRVRLMNDGRNLGKIVRLNYLLETFTGDVFVQFDADVALASPHVLAELVAPLTDEHVGLTFGSHRPLAPTTFIERVGVFGADFWEDIVDRAGERGRGHHCSGQIRAFSRRFANQFRCPTEAGSIEDVYSFYRALELGFQPVYVRAAQIQFRLPTTLDDYLKQMGRYVVSPATLTNFFSVPLIDRYRGITGKDRLEALGRALFSRNVGFALAYAFLHLLARLYVTVKPVRSAWEVSQSSKQLLP